MNQDSATRRVHGHSDAIHIPQDAFAGSRLSHFCRTRRSALLQKLAQCLGLYRWSRRFIPDGIRIDTPDFTKDSAGHLVKSNFFLWIQATVER